MLIYAYIHAYIHAYICLACRWLNTRCVEMKRGYMEMMAICACVGQHQRHDSQMLLLVERIADLIQDYGQT